MLACHSRAPPPLKRPPKGPDNEVYREMPVMPVRAQAVYLSRDRD